MAKKSSRSKRTGIIVVAILAVFFLLFSTMWIMVIYLGNNPSRVQPPTIPPIVDDMPSTDGDGILFEGLFNQEPTVEIGDADETVEEIEPTFDEE